MYAKTEGDQVEIIEAGQHKCILKMDTDSEPLNLL